ncbi:MAG: hypothetical protein ACREUE_19395 [Panacagrimonas sp.]
MNGLSISGNGQLSSRGMSWDLGDLAGWVLVERPVCVLAMGILQGLISHADRRRSASTRSSRDARNETEKIPGLTPPNDSAPPDHPR